jgi:signal transduction histidine kinase
MSPIMNPDMIEHGRRLEHQVAGVIQLVADLQDDLDQLAGMPVAARAAAALAQRRAALEDTIATLRQDQGELELRLEQRNAELASREDALDTTRSQLQVLTRRLVQVQEDERRALARDLHDTSGQAMTVINVGLAMLKRDSGCSDKTHARIEDLRRVAATVAEDLHRLSVNLRPSSLDRYGLVPALEDLVASLRKQTGIEVDFAVAGLDDRLPGEMETALYRIVQEATTKTWRAIPRRPAPQSCCAGRHARSKCAWQTTAAASTWPRR